MVVDFSFWMKVTTARNYKEKLTDVFICERFNANVTAVWIELSPLKVSHCVYKASLLNMSCFCMTEELSQNLVLLQAES